MMQPNMTLGEMIDETIGRIVERHFMPADPPPADNDNDPKDSA